MKTNFDLVKDRSIVMDGDGSSTMPYKIFPTVKDFVDFLNLTVKEDILDKEERKYIKNIIRPFRNQIIDICKNQFDDKYEYVYITYQEENKDIAMHIYLPNFKKNTMYAGMSLNQHYTLEELGITFKN